MAKSSLQKLKLLYIRDYFYRCSDEQHPVTVPMIIKMLENKDINAERKSIYDDIIMLRDFYGMDIICEKRGSYYLGEREFQLPETKLLIDTVSSSKFLTEKKSAELIKKLELFSSVYQAKEFSTQTFLQTRIKNMNESIYFTVDDIFTAINNDRQIKFRYYHYNENKAKIYSKNGSFYCVSPYAMLIDGDNYYLVAYDGEKQILRHFRADRIENIETTDSRRIGNEHFNPEDYKGVGSKMFSMFSGEKTNVTLRFDNNLAGVVIDRFGKNGVFVKTDESHFDINVELVISPQFFGWIFGLQGGVRIISPKNIVNEYEEYLKNELGKYENKGD